MKLAALMAIMLMSCVSGQAGAVPEPSPSSARILEFDGKQPPSPPNAGGSPSIDVRGLRRTEIVGPIYEDKFALVPPGAYDTVQFFFAFVKRFGELCPSLPTMTPQVKLNYLFATTVGLADRVLSGRGTSQENALMITGALATLNEHHSCQYNPSTESYGDAQRRCNEAANSKSALLGTAAANVHADARHDADLLVSRYKCSSSQLNRMATQLHAFAQEAPARSNFKSGIPVRQPGKDDKLYSTIFDNCSRRAPGTTNAWCACYVNALAHNNPSDRVLNALAENPFVDGGYMAVPFAADLYACTDHHKEGIRWRDGYLPRTTACLIDSKPASTGGEECTYRAAWGKFSMTRERCEKDITSRAWGYVEVDCAKDGMLAKPSAGPREVREHRYTKIHYEDAVPADFSPPMPRDVREKVPLVIDLVKNRKPKALSRIHLEQAGSFRMHVMGPLRVSREVDLAIRQDLHAMNQEGQLLLVCHYNNANGTVSSHYYWYEKLPNRITSGKLNAGTAPFFERVEGAATSCLSTNQER